MIRLREFRAEDASGEGDIVRELLTGGDPFIGLTAEIDGRVGAYGGVRKIYGRHWAFFNVVDAAARRPILLHRTTVAAIQRLSQSGIAPLFTFCDASKPSAEAWLCRLGFRPLTDDEKDSVILATEQLVGHGTWVREAANG